jgi:hypothetical protein
MRHNVACHLSARLLARVVRKREASRKIRNGAIGSIRRMPWDKAIWRARSSFLWGRQNQGVDNT